MTSVPPTLTTGVAAGVTYALGPNGLVVIDGNRFTTSAPTTSTLADGRVVVIGPTGAVSVQKVSPNPQRTHSVTPRDYVLGAFVPTIIAVLFSIPWRILDSAIKDMEPYYQLQRQTGALAEHSLTLSYRASISVAAIFSAIRNGHHVVWWSGVIYMVILLLAPLASETVFIGFVDPGGCSTTSSRTECIPQLSVFPTAARVVEGCLTFIVILTVALAIVIARRRSGVYANPLSIAGLATLFQDRRVIDDFRRIQSFNPSSKELRDALRGNRYRIGEHIDMCGRPLYGITTVQNDTQPIETSYQTSFGGKKYASVAVNPVDESPARRPREEKPVANFGTHAAVVTVFGLCVCGLLILVVYYNRVGASTPFERFMNSGSFGTNFLFTAVGVAIKLYWAFLDDGA